MNIRSALAIGGAALCLAGCNTTSITPVTAAICTDVAALQASTVALNANEKLAVTAASGTCAATSQGTVFSNATLATALINDALLLQASGLLSDIHITAQAPDDQKVLRKIKLHWERDLAKL